MRNFRKFALISLLVTSFVCEANNYCFGVSDKNEVYAVENNCEPTGVQIRGSGDYYFVLICPEFDGKTTNKTVTNINSYSIVEKVDIYLNKNSDPIKLSSIIDGNALQNIWSQSGLFIRLKQEAFETYNGSTVYKIVVNEGCEFPIEGVTYKINDSFQFVNNAYGDASKKDSAFYFTKTKLIEYIDDVLESDFVQVRGDYNAPNCNYLVVRDKKYETISSITLSADYYQFPILNKIKFYMSENDSTGIFLLDVVNADDNWILNQWTCGGIMFQIRNDKFDLYNGCTIYAIELISGLAIPCGNKKLILNQTIKYYNLGFGDESLKYSSFENYWSTAKPREPIDIETVINGVEVRGDEINQTAYVNLRFDDAISMDPASFRLNKLSADGLKNIILYKNKDDEGTSLFDIFDPDLEWHVNFWECHGILVPIKFSIFINELNGRSTYALEVGEDVRIPYFQDYLLVTESKYFINSRYNSDNSEYTYNGFYFSEKPKNLINFGYVDILGLQNRANDAARWLMLTVSENFEETINCSSYVSDLNMLEKIEIYLNKFDNPILLKDIYAGPVDNRLFGEPTTLGIIIDLDERYQGPKMYKVKFSAGLQIPYFENGVYGYRVLKEDCIMLNEEYGLTGQIFNVFDENGLSRTYEYWNVNWVKIASISFVVNGIEQLSFPTIDASFNDFISLDNYEKSGYKLEVVMDNGNRVLQGFYPNKSSIVLTLNYSPISENNTGDKKGCSSSLITSSLVLTCVSILGCLLLLKRKENF